jgi:hypothetical protein
MSVAFYYGQDGFLEFVALELCRGDEGHEEVDVERPVNEVCLRKLYASLDNPTRGWL